MLNPSGNILRVPSESHNKNCPITTRISRGITYYVLPTQEIHMILQVAQRLSLRPGDDRKITCRAPSHLRHDIPILCNASHGSPPKYQVRRHINSPMSEDILCVCTKWKTSLWHPGYKNSSGRIKGSSIEIPTCG